jgi:hypothetical protein
VQAATLCAILVEQNEASLRDSLGKAPARLGSPARAPRPTLLSLLEAHPEAMTQLELVVPADQPPRANRTRYIVL